MALLAARGRPAIAVGIPNAGKSRILEYSPFVDPYYGGGLGGHYLDFIARTVKPLIDSSFATRPEPEATGLVGSSLGGILAVYGLAERPDVFGLCAALSPSCWFARQALNRHLTGITRAEGRFYLDVGMGEGRRRSWRPPARTTAATTRGTRFTKAVDRVASKLSKKLPKKTGAAGRDLLYVVDPVGEHNERHWRRRLPIALSFLLADIS
jgi:predicted alpha/beta superfamily hydrolase